MRYLFLNAFIFTCLICSCQSSGNNQDADAAGFIQLFDGKTLTNWTGDSIYWKVENGCIVGEVVPATLLKHNSFIIWQGGEKENFELKLDYRISENGNSGINYRSEMLDSIPNALRGYQFDLDGQNKYTGQNYEEKKRTTLAYRGQKVVVAYPKNAGDPESLKANIKNNAWQSFEKIEALDYSDSLVKVIKKGDWNQCHLIINGNRMQHYVNNILMSDVTDNDVINRKNKGLIGVQVHVGPPMKVEFRNIRIKEIK